jgi:hypothetical protein
MASGKPCKDGPVQRGEPPGQAVMVGDVEKAAHGRLDTPESVVEQGALVTDPKPIQSAGGIAEEGR